MSPADVVEHRAGIPGTGEPVDADPITTEVVRHALNSSANQMKRALVRTSFSPIIYEVLDFAVALYDRRIRLLAQAPSLPMFMGKLSFCVGAAVDAVGGEEALEPGDIIIDNWPYHTGAHGQDCSVIMPVFGAADELIGYAAIMGHLLDVGAKDPYCTDTIDVFQEGTFFPGVKLYKGGVRDEEIYRIALANSRVPRSVAGDLNAEIVGVRTGARALRQVYERFEPDVFWSSVENMFNRCERNVRSYFEKIPSGRYVGSGVLDNNGVTDDPVPFEIAVEVSGSDVKIDFSGAPEQQAGPHNSPLPATLCVSRIAISMLAGYNEAPNEGHFRPITAVTRPGTMFHPLPPAPCFLTGWPGLQAVEVIYRAVSAAAPTRVPAASGGCLSAIVWWGMLNGEPWADGSPHPCGQGAWHDGDGGTMMHICESATHFSPIEVWETRNPWLIEKMELAVDSCGPGKFRGGPGIDYHFRMLEQTNITTVVDRTKNPPWGLEGGGAARPNGAGVRLADGRFVPASKATRFEVPKGAVVELSTGGGGGYGPPADRPPEAVEADLRDGYITSAFAHRHYPQVERDETPAR